MKLFVLHPFFLQGNVAKPRPAAIERRFFFLRDLRRIRAEVNLFFTTNTPFSDCLFSGHRYDDEEERNDCF